MTLRRATWLATFLALALLAIEVAAPPWLASRIEHRIEEGTRGALRVDATVTGFPVITRLAVTGRLRELELEVTQVAGRPVPLARLALGLHEVAFDRRSLLSDDVEISGVGSGRLSATVADVSPAVLEALRFAVGESGTFQTTLTDQGVQLELPVVGAFTVPVPRGVVSCPPEIRVAQDAVVLSCTFDEVPALLQQGLGLLAQQPATGAPTAAAAGWTPAGPPPGSADG